MGGKLDRIDIKGFKSIKNDTIEFRDLNVLIGPNGSGKSNLLSVFDLLRSIFDKDLSQYIGINGINALMYNGVKTTGSIEIRFTFGQNGYGFELRPNNEGSMIFGRESFYFNDTSCHLGKGHTESLLDNGVKNRINPYVIPLIEDRTWRIYHFHDTGPKSTMKQYGSISNNISLAEDAGNLAAYLCMLKDVHPESYSRIVQSVRAVIPYFDDFILRPNPRNEELIRLEWKTKGNDEPFNPHQLSDGTLRFICLATLLLQPAKLQPSTIIIDEPELGLHPAAVTVLSEMIHEVTERPVDNKQIIITTQSVELLDEFDVEDIIVVDRVDDGSKFRRLNAKELDDWLDDYTLSELWAKNIIGGRP